MSFERVPLGVFSNFYCGDWLDNTDELVEIEALNTAPNELIDQTPFTRFPGIDVLVQTGPRTVTVNLSFYSDEIMIHNLTGGMSVANTDKNTEPGGNFYSLLLLYPDDTDNSVYIPRCFVTNVRRLERSKESGTAVQVIFTAISENRFVNTMPHPDRDYEPVIVYDTPDNLDTLLASRSPL